MSKELTRKEAHEKIQTFFARENFTSEEVKKIKRLAMKFRIRLGNYRQLFCANCFSKLEGKTRISKNYKNVMCDFCGNINRLRFKKAS